MDPAVELAVDGFPLDPNDPDIRYHRELSTWLELAQTAHIPVALQFDATSERPHWLRPAVRRFAWVRTHATLIAGDRKLDFRLGHLISHLVNRLYKPESGALRSRLRVSRRRRTADKSFSFCARASMPDSKEQ